MSALGELEGAYESARRDSHFQAELERDLRQYCGRPTPLYHAHALSIRLGGAQIFLKREDLNHTGSHHLNNALGHVRLAQRLGKSSLIAETGSGQHGVAVAAAAARAGMPCRVFMGTRDIQQNAFNVRKMRAFGARVVPVESGDAALRGALGEAMRAWIADLDSAHFVPASASGPHPYPKIARDFQTVIGLETQAQLSAFPGGAPYALIACVGGGSNALGLFHPFLPSESLLIGVEAAGKSAAGEMATHGSVGRPGILHGSRTYASAVSACRGEAASLCSGLNYPSVGPEHAWLKDTGRVSYVAIADQQAADACLLLARTEGILPAMESGYAIAYAAELAPSLSVSERIVVNVSGSGDKDVDALARRMEEQSAQG